MLDLEGGVGDVQPRKVGWFPRGRYLSLLVQKFHDIVGGIQIGKVGGPPIDVVQLVLEDRGLETSIIKFLPLILEESGLLNRILLLCWIFFKAVLKGVASS